MHYTNKDLRDNFARSFLDAARSGRTDICLNILKTHPTANITDENGNNPLHLAILSDNLLLVSILLRKRSKYATVKNDADLTPMAFAAASHISRKWNCVRLFLDHIHSKDDAELFGANYALIGAVKADKLWLAKELLEKGAQQNLRDIINNDFLYKDLLDKNLLTKNTQQHLRDELVGGTCLHHAVLNDNKEMIKLLMLHHGNISQRNTAGITPLNLASKRARDHKQSWDCFNTMNTVELQKRHGTTDDSNFSQIKSSFQRNLVDYCRSRFIYNWQFVRHHDRAYSFLEQLANETNMTDVIALINKQLGLFEESAIATEHAKTKYQRLPDHRVKDGFNQLLEDFLENFERLENQEKCKLPALPLTLSQSQEESPEMEEKHTGTNKPR